mgnify:CR=1 FL=1
MSENTGIEFKGLSVTVPHSGPKRVFLNSWSSKLSTGIPVSKEAMSLSLPAHFLICQPDLSSNHHI